MTAAPYRLRVDERVIGAGANVRFALLLILLLVSSASMILAVITGLSGANDQNGHGCQLAAGADPLHSTEIAVQAHTAAQNAAFEACIARYEVPPPLLVTMGWPILVLVVAVALFCGLPVWKRRPGRVVPLSAVDRDDSIASELAELATEVADLARTPRFVIDPAAMSANAVVFGSTRRPTICLHGGLIVRRAADPTGFRAVVLHELAHVGNRDVTVTYLTVALWRVFLTLVLLPYLVWTAVAFVTEPQSVDWSIDAPSLVRNVLFTVLMVTLVYLARSDVLRSREIYADLAAACWGAHQHGWAPPAPPPDRGALWRTLGSFVELWRTHPRWDLRLASLTDPAVLFGVPALPLFLTGAAATLIQTQARNYAGQYLHDVTWSSEVIAAGVAVLVTAAAGTTLWRAVTHSVLTGRPAPSGMRAGLWLGAGMATAELVVDDLSAYHWLPAHPEVLVVVICAGAVFACWTTQCAQLWLRAWPGRMIRPAVLIGLATGSLVLSAWFEWWAANGSVYAYGVPDLVTATAARLVDDHTSAFVAVLPVLAHGVLVMPAVATLWIVPLLIWAGGRGGAIPRWVRVAQQRTGDVMTPVSGLPSLRRTILAAVPGGVFGWIVLVGAMAYLHTVQPPGPLGATEPAVPVYMVWVLVAWVAGMAVAAVIASAASRAYGLLAALIASQTAGLVGVAGMFPAAAVDGCVPGLATLQSSCDWRPGTTWPMFAYLVAPACVVGTVAAVAAAVVVSAVQRLRGAGRSPVPSLATLRGQVVRGAGAVALGAMFVGLVIAGAMSLPSNASSASAAPSSSTVAGDAPPSTQTRAFQAGAWAGHGGSDLLARFTTAANDYLTLLDNGHGEVDDSRVHPFCVEFDRLATDADAYFHVPDPQAQSLWRTFIAQTRTIGQDCDKAVAESNGDLLVKSASEAVQAAITENAVEIRVIAVMKGGGG
ncbi:M56 family metallopeptidase [Kutzneria sp. CA-103260]|uniref:M56 family metallopeptidase n=1 Tax=Kutzneria sp. CA-103260 TaxID=2802641 RepID=UPI001BAAE734|nr:M56 family metallopeptidase [Kutzneria sp. CA-103260]QUQ64511.1 Protease HtpX [Kutzneria sp. CA-103260]